MTWSCTSVSGTFGSGTIHRLMNVKRFRAFSRLSAVVHGKTAKCWATELKMLPSRS